MPGPDASAPPQVDRVLGGRYRLIRPIAKGGMAEVWEGHDDILSRPVAVKMLLPHLASDQSLVERFRREAISAARLSHPGVVATYDTGTDHGTAWIVMELVRGHTLRQLLNERGPMDPPMAVDVAGQIADALAHAHRAGLVHRDIKPANVLLVEEDAGPPRAKVTDFGIAKATEGIGLDLTKTGMVLGTPKYLSPEQVEGHEPDARADLYSLGVVLFEMLTCRVPFEGPTDMATAVAHVRQLPPRVSSIRPDVPVELDQLVADLLAKDPSARIPSAVSLRQALARIPLRPGDGGSSVRPSTTFSSAPSSSPPSSFSASPPPPPPDGRVFAPRPVVGSGAPSPAASASSGAGAPGSAASGAGGSGSGGSGSGSGSPGFGTLPPSTPDSGFAGSGLPGSGAAGSAAPVSGAPSPVGLAARTSTPPSPAGTPPRPGFPPPSGATTPPPPGGIPTGVAPANALSGGVGQSNRLAGGVGAAGAFGGGGPAAPTRLGAASASATGVLTRDAPPAAPPLPPRRRRRWRRWLPGTAVLALLVAGGVVAYVLLSGTDLGSRAHLPKIPHLNSGPNSTTASGPVSIAQVQVWMNVTGHSEDNPGETGLAIDGNPNTYWSTVNYTNRTFGNLYSGEGLAIKLDSSHTVHQLTVTTSTSGWAAQTYVANSLPAIGQPTSAWGSPTDTKTDISGSTTFNLGGKSGTYVLLWLTNLGPSLHAQVNELKVSS